MGAYSDILKHVTCFNKICLVSKNTKHNFDMNFTWGLLWGKNDGDDLRKS